MKIAESVAVLSLVLVFNAANANDETASDSDNVSAYCQEQAELAGIEDANEKRQYTQECIDSFAVQGSEAQPEN